ARRREASGDPWFNATDLYPDALPAIAALRQAGYLVGVAGNQPEETERVIASLGIPFDLVASSDGLGVAKPDPAFFERVADALRPPKCGRPGRASRPRPPGRPGPSPTWAPSSTTT